MPCWWVPERAWAWTRGFPTSEVPRASGGRILALRLCRPPEMGAWRIYWHLLAFTGVYWRFKHPQPTVMLPAVLLVTLLAPTLAAPIGDGDDGLIAIIRRPIFRNSFNAPLSSGG